MAPKGRQVSNAGESLATQGRIVFKRELTGRRMVTPRELFACAFNKESERHIKNIFRPQNLEGM